MILGKQSTLVGYAALKVLAEVCLLCGDIRSRVDSGILTLLLRFRLLELFLRLEVIGVVLIVLFRGSLRCLLGRRLLDVSLLQE